MLASFNPFGPTGGNPIVKVLEIAGTPYWSFYEAYFGDYPPDGVTFALHQPPGSIIGGYLEYNDAWEACKNFYMHSEGEGGYGMPGYTMEDEGLTLGNPNVPGFTFNDIGLEITAEPPTFGYKPTP